MLECATLVANANELDFTVGPALPTTQLSFPGDDFGRLPLMVPQKARGVMVQSSHNAAASVFASSQVKTPCDERPEPEWTTPVPLRARPSDASLSTIGDQSPAGAGAGFNTSDRPPSLRLLRPAESSPALSNQSVPENWRARSNGLQFGVPVSQGFQSSQGCPFGQLPSQQMQGSDSLAQHTPQQSLLHANHPFHLQMANTPSPLAGSPQRPCGSKRVRRTQSMFPSSQQFLTAELGAGGANAPPSPGAGATGLGSVPTFSVPEDSFPRISSQVLVELLDGKIKHQYDSIKIIDCRFEYEYAGGHIAGATNISCKTKLEEQMFSQAPIAGMRQLIIFHCEYSAYRGPLMATHMRQCDRRANVYPKLTYPDIAVLDGGYSRFYAINRGRCEPQNYVGMNDDSHKKTCEREMERFRTGMRFRKSQLFSRPSVSFSDLPKARFEPKQHQRPSYSCTMLPLAKGFDGDSRKPFQSLNH